MDDADVTEEMRAVAAQAAEYQRAHQCVIRGPEACEDCATEMVEICRVWGFTRCVECQAAHEVRVRVFGGKK